MKLVAITDFNLTIDVVFDLYWSTFAAFNGFK